MKYSGTQIRRKTIVENVLSDNVYVKFTTYKKIFTKTVNKSHANERIRILSSNRERAKYNKREQSSVFNA